LESLLDILFQASAQNSLQFRRALPSRFAQFLRPFPQDCGHRFRRRFAPEGALAGQHFVQHRAKAKDIGPRISRFAPNLLG